MKPIFFPKPTDFRNWLKKNAGKETEIIVGFYKVDSGKPSITWSESVDEALCFGWIDGIRRSIDRESYSIRFTPRRRTSIWSEINIRKVEKLIALGLMQPSGLQAYSYRKEEKSGIYSFERNLQTLPVDLEDKFKSNQKAWEFFLKQAPSYQKLTTHWIMAAQQEKTRLSRLEKAIVESEQQKRLWDNYK